MATALNKIRDRKALHLEAGNIRLKAVRRVNELNVEGLLSSQRLLDKRTGVEARIAAMNKRYADSTSKVLNSQALKALERAAFLEVPTLTSIFFGFESARASAAERERLAVDADIAQENVRLKREVELNKVDADRRAQQAKTISDEAKIRADVVDKLAITNSPKDSGSRGGGKEPQSGFKSNFGITNQIRNVAPPAPAPVGTNTVLAPAPAPAPAPVGTNTVLAPSGQEKTLEDDVREVLKEIIPEEGDGRPKKLLNQNELEGTALGLTHELMSFVRSNKSPDAVARRERRQAGIKAIPKVDKAEVSKEEEQTPNLARKEKILLDRVRSILDALIPTPEGSIQPVITQDINQEVLNIAQELQTEQVFSGKEANIPTFTLSNIAPPVLRTVAQKPDVQPPMEVFEEPIIIPLPEEPEIIGEPLPPIVDRPRNIPVSEEVDNVDVEIPPQIGATPIIVDEAIPLSTTPNLPDSRRQEEAITNTDVQIDREVLPLDTTPDLPDSTAQRHQLVEKIIDRKIQTEEITPTTQEDLIVEVLEEDTAGPLVATQFSIDPNETYILGDPDRKIPIQFSGQTLLDTTKKNGLEQDRLQSLFEEGIITTKRGE